MIRYLQKLSGIVRLSQEEWIEINDTSEYRNYLMNFRITNTYIHAKGDITYGLLIEDSLKFRDIDVAELYARWLYDQSQSGSLYVYVEFGLEPNSGMWMSIQIVHMDDLGRPTTDMFDVILDLYPNKSTITYGAFCNGKALITDTDNPYKTI
jgi:hypothetical protein